MKDKKKYNDKRRKLSQAKIVADMAVELEQFVLQIAFQKNKEGNLLMDEIRGVADWWVKTMRQEDPTRNHIRVAARSAFLQVIEAKVCEQAKTEVTEAKI